MTEEQVIKAWYSVKDRWFTRLNKEHTDGRQIEVVHDWGTDVIDDATMEVIARYSTFDEAQKYAEHCQNMANAKAVLTLLKS